MKAKRILAGLSAFAIAAAMAGAVPFAGAQLLDTAVTASAEDAVQTETFDLSAKQNSDPNYASADPFTIERTDVDITGHPYDPDGWTVGYVYVGDSNLQNCDLTVSAKNGKLITKVELVIGYVSGAYDLSKYSSNADNIECTNIAKNNKMTLTSENGSDSINLRYDPGSGSNDCIQFKGVTVYYTDAADTREMTVTYTVDPSYTVTIPADVTITDSGSAAEITANDVLLEEGQKIKVALTGADNTTEGSVFTAKNGTSEIKYSITEGEDENTKTIALGDTVAEFTAAGSQELTFTKTGGSPTIAGDHTENLTFTVSVEEGNTLTLTVNVYKGLDETYLDPIFEDTALTFNYTDDTTWADVFTDTVIEQYTLHTSGNNIADRNSKILHYNNTPVNLTDKVKDASDPSKFEWIEIVEEEIKEGE